jgi:thioredoxin-related protein
LVLFPYFASSLGWVPSWQIDFVQASKDAAKEHKYILLDFTGSDWCPWCIKMNKEAFSQAKFSLGYTKSVLFAEPALI